MFFTIQGYNCLRGVYLPAHSFADLWRLDCDALGRHSVLQALLCQENVASPFGLPSRAD